MLMNIQGGAYHLVNSQQTIVLYSFSSSVSDFKRLLLIMVLSVLTFIILARYLGLFL